MKPLSALWNLALSPTNRMALLYAFTGVGFSGANLILAKALPAAEYGTLALVVSIFAVAAPLAPLGADGVILRNLLNPHPRILARVVVTSLGVSTVTVVAALLLYHLPSGLLPLLGVGLATGGVTMAAAASYQRLHRFIPGLLLQQSANLFLISASLIILAGVMRVLWFPVAGGTTLRRRQWRQLVTAAIGTVADSTGVITRAFGGVRCVGGRSDRPVPNTSDGCKLLGITENEVC
ncbi:MAG: hypothetical protein P8X82_15345 [Gemmatimonadales bacterium]